MRDPRLEPGVTRGLERSGACHILRLPQTLILKLLSFLNSKELARVSATCKQLRQLCWSENLWTSIVLAGESLDTDRAVRAILSRLVWAREGRDGAPGVTTVVLSGCARYHPSFVFGSCGASNMCIPMHPSPGYNHLFPPQAD